MLQAIEIHIEAGIQPRLVVMNRKNFMTIVEEAFGYRDLFWAPDSANAFQFFGVNVEVRDFIQDGDVIIGV